MPCQFSMIFLEYLRIFGTENTTGGASTCPRGSRARPPLQGAPPTSWAHGGPPPLIHAPTHSLFLLKNPIHLKHEFQLILLRFSISLLKAPFTKLLWEIVAWYVTPPLVQLVFDLVLYSLQIFAAQVTMFLSLHVEFMRSQAILMHDIGSRHLQEQLLPILFSFIHFYFEVTKNFRIFRK